MEKKLQLKQILLLVLTLLTTILIYSNTFSVPFVFDDVPAIAKNAVIKNFNLASILNYSHARFLVYLSFAINYALSGLNVTPYHIVNLIIHLFNTILVFILVEKILKTRLFKEKIDSSNNFLISFFASFIFAVHPIQTQAVTYVVQRSEELLALFYLLTLVSYINFYLNKTSGPKIKYSWYAFSIIFALMATITKEISITIPFAIILLHICFYDFKKDDIYYILPFIFTAIFPAIVGFEFSKAEENATTITKSDYFITSLSVLVTYIRLLFLPINQNLDYDYPIFSSFVEPRILFSTCILCLIIGLGIYFFFKNKKVYTFGIFWFFIILSITSSFVVIRDVIFENRLYLAVISFALLFPYFFYEIFTNLLLKGRFKKIWPVFPIIAIILFSYATYQRNDVWKTEISIWEDVVKKSPYKSRGYNNLGMAYIADKNWEKAKENLERCIWLDPYLSRAYNNLGVIYLRHDDYKTAGQYFLKAVIIQPGFAEANNNLGLVYSHERKFKKAIECYERAIKNSKYYAEGYDNLGMVYYELGQREKAYECFNKAVELDPLFATAYLHRGLIHYDKNEYELAFQEYNTALEIAPNDKGLQNNIGLLYFKCGQDKKAKEHFEKAIELDPKFPEALFNLCLIYLKENNWPEINKRYEIALKDEKLRPIHLNNLGLLYSKDKKYKQAFSVFEKIIKQYPNDVEGYTNLANIYYDLKKYDMAEKYYLKASGIYPELAFLNYMAGMCEFHKKNYNKAIEYYLTATQKDPEYLDAYNNLSIAYFKIGLYRQSKNAAEKAVEIDPNNIRAVQLLDFINSFYANKRQSDNL